MQECFEPPKDNQIRLTALAHPLTMDRTELQVPEGLTILEMLEIAQPDPVLLKDAVVFVDDYEVPRHLWHIAKPKVGRTVTARVIPVPRGSFGGGGGGKNPLRILLSIAVIAAAFFLGPALGVALGFSGATAAAVGGAIISVAGNLLVNVIAPVKPPKLPNLAGGAGSVVQESPSVFLNGSRNQERLFEAVPSILGFYRVRPPKGAKTFTEVLGDSNVLHDIFVVGLGKLEFEEWRIGNTPIENFSDYVLEERNGTDADAALTVYPNQVRQEEFSIKLTEEADWQVRTSDLNADEISIDISFPRGLTRFNNGGGRSNRTVVMEVQWRKVGEATFIDLPTGDDITTTFDKSNISGTEVTFRAARSVALRHGIRWKTGERAQYEIRVRRTTADTTSTQIFDEAFWSATKTFTNDPPITPPVPLAMAGLEIRATDQLNGVVDTLSVLAKSVVLDYDSGSGTWIERASNNCASLFRHVLQGPGKASPLPDSLIDIDGLQTWHTFCVDNGFTFNMVRDFTTSVIDVLSSIAAAGRAGLTITNGGKIGVVIDQPQAYPVTHITPRNSFDFQMEKSFLDKPHAWRIRFPNELQDYNQDERTVYREGFDSTNSTLFEALEFEGVTNPDHVWKLGRFHGAQIEERPERWNVSQDFEAMVAKRGDRVKITHDIILVGLASGRIKSLTKDGSNAITAITVDETLTMESGKSYGLVIRRAVSGDTHLDVPIATLIGDATTVTPLTPIADGSDVEVGDLFGFGEVGQATEDGVVLFTTGEDELAGRLTLVPYRESIFSADDGPIPTHTPTITAEAFLPAPTIADVVTDESVLEAGAGDTALTRAHIEAIPLGGNFERPFLEVQQRLSGSEDTFYFGPSTRISPNIVSLSDVQQGDTYDFRARWNHEGLLPSPWTERAGVTIVGKSSAPSALTGMTISVFGGQAHIRWDQPPELDVQFGGTVRFRHTSELLSPAWSASAPIGQAAQARALFASLPLKSGSYIARVFDSSGNPAETVTSVSTKQASVLEFANVNTVQEDSTFSGTMTNMFLDGDHISLVGSGLFDDIADFDAEVGIDSFGGLVLSGTYEFSAALDLTTVQRVRLTSDIGLLIVNQLDRIDDRTENIDDWEDFDATLQASVDATLWVRSTDDDPAGSPTWTSFERLDSAEFEARGFEFELRVSSADAAFNIQIDRLRVNVERIT